MGTYYPVQTRICAGDFVRLVKKLLRLPLRFRFYANRTWVKKSALIFGNSICCPSCTYNYSLIGDHMFDSGYSFALDWENLLSLAERPGRFVCVEEPLIAYRVHSGGRHKKMHRGSQAGRRTKRPCSADCGRIGWPVF